MKRILVATMASLALKAWGQNEPLFTTLCIAEKSVGFNWEKGDWVHTRFKADSKYIVQKIDHDSQKYSQTNTINTPFFCSGIKPDSMEIGLEESAREACYSIRDHGRDVSLMLSAEKCFEKYNKHGTLTEVQCKKIRFSPNGLFIAMPSDASMDLSKAPKNDYKDSLNIRVGTCSKVN